MVSRGPSTSRWPLLGLLGLLFGAQVVMISHIRHQSTCSGSGGDSQPTSLAAVAPSDPLEDPPLPRLAAPLIVGCLANMRTVSTTAFNLARVLMERVDPNSGSGWEKDVTGPQKGTLNRDVIPKAKGQVSFVYKSHIAAQEYHEAADFFLITYRDPYDMVCSMAKMFKPELFTNDAMAIQKCHKMATNEELIQRLAAKAGHGALHVESSVLHSVEGMTKVVEAMARKWDVQGGVVDARHVAREVMELKAPPPGIFPVAHPRTELHANHITTSKGTPHDCDAMRKVLAADRRCRVWHDKYEKMFPPGTSELIREEI